MCCFFFFFLSISASLRLDWETGKQGNRETGKQGNRETGKQGNRETGKQGNKELGKQRIMDSRIFFPPAFILETSLSKQQRRYDKTKKSNGQKNSSTRAFKNFEPPSAKQQKFLLFP